MSELPKKPRKTKVSELLKKPKKKSIPATLKRLVWDKYIGESIGKTKCLCCDLTDITQMSFHCGHVIADINGGTMTIDNLRPICQNCNLSMRKTNMNIFKSILQTTKEEIKIITPDSKKLKEFELEYNNCIKVIIMLKDADNKARHMEIRNFQMSKEFEKMACHAIFNYAGKTAFVIEYEQITKDILNLESSITPMNIQILSSKTDNEFNELYDKFIIEKQKLIKISEKLKARWRITETFNL
jgi:hypothetical protein